MSTNEAQIRIDPEFEKIIPPIAPYEFELLEEDIVETGEVREPIVLWNGIIVDGHNRWKIIQKHPEVKWSTRNKEFADKEEAFYWMRKNQLTRRNLTDEWAMYIRGKIYETRKRKEGGDGSNQYGIKERPQNGDVAKKQRTVKKVAQELGVGKNTVLRSADFAKGVDAIREVNPAAADKVLSGKAKVTKTEIQEMKEMVPDEIAKKVEDILNDVERPKKANNGYNREMRELRETINKANSTIRDTDTPSTYSVDDFVEEIKVNGEVYVQQLHTTLQTHHTILIESQETLLAVQNAISAIMRNIRKEMPIYEG